MRLGALRMHPGALKEVLLQNASGRLHRRFLVASESVRVGVVGGTRAVATLLQ